MDEHHARAKLAIRMHERRLIKTFTKIFSSVCRPPHLVDLILYSFSIMVALTSGWFLFLCSLFLRGASTLRVQDTCEEVGLPGGQLLYVYKHPNATTRTYVHQGECSTDSILGPGKWVGLGGNGLNWRVLMSDMGNVETEAIVLEGNCTDLRCVASSKDSDQGNNQVVWEAKDGISYYIFTSATSEMEQDSFKFRASLEVRPSELYS
jgi:hypothetical protein